MKSEALPFPWLLTLSTQEFSRKGARTRAPCCLTGFALDGLSNLVAHPTNMSASRSWSVLPWLIEWHGSTVAKVLAAVRPDGRRRIRSTMYSSLRSDFDSFGPLPTWRPPSRNWAVRFTLKNRRRQPGLSGPKSANKRHIGKQTFCVN